jgi:hypothetical protein
MKRLVVIIILLSTCSMGIGQVVFRESFEEPVKYKRKKQIGYFKNCFTVENVRELSYQNDSIFGKLIGCRPFDGQGFVLLGEPNRKNKTNKEFVIFKLSENLLRNQSYKISFHVKSLTANTKVADISAAILNDDGVLNRGYLKYTTKPQISTLHNLNTISSSKGAEWIRIEGGFTASGSESVVVIGFFEDVLSKKVAIDLVEIESVLMDSMLVPNGNFETYYKLPFSDYSGNGFVSHWNHFSKKEEVNFTHNKLHLNINEEGKKLSKIDVALGTPDYFHKSFEWGLHSFRNKNDTVHPKLGYGYMGFCIGSIHDNDFKTGNEYVQIRLSDKLNKDSLYKFTMHVRLQKKSDFTTNTLGVKFSSDLLEKSVDSMRIVATADFSINGLILNESSWKKITFKYKATGNEQYLTIGDFSTGINVNHQRLHKYGNNHAYIFIDEVSLVKITGDIP